MSTNDDSAQKEEDAQKSQAEHLLEIADAAEKGELKVTWLTKMPKEDRRKLLFRNIPQS